jgi:hypothetical protein
LGRQAQNTVPDVLVQLLPSDIGSKVKAMDVHEKARLITNKKNNNSDVLSDPKKAMDMA